MQNVKSILIGLLLGIIILLSLLVSVSIIYEDEVSQYLVEELNEHILSEIKISDINFSLIKKFPKASLEFKDVIAFSKQGYFKDINGFNTDTLFYAKSISVQLNLLDILSKQYNISSIHFNKGKINLFIDRFGDQNYIFWDNSAQTTDTTDFKLDIKDVRITNSDLLYCNEAKNLVLQSYVNRIDFKGNFSRQNYLMKIKSDLLVKNLQIEHINYIENKNLHSNFSLDIVNNNIGIRNGFLNFENLKLNLNGNIKPSENQSIDLMISGKELDLKSLSNNLPKSIKNEISVFSVQKGEVTLNINIVGSNIKTSNPHISALFLIKNAQLFDNERNLKFDNISIEGEFSNGKHNNASSSAILFKKFKTNLKSNYFEGSLELSNLKIPEIKCDINSELYFNEIKNIFKLDTLDVFKGLAKAKIKYRGSYEDLKLFSFPDLFTKDYFIDINIKNGEIKLKNKPLIVSDISGRFKINKTLNADSLFFRIYDNDFLINGRIFKLYEYFKSDEIFNIKAQLVSRKININELAQLFTNSKSGYSNSRYSFPNKLALKLQLDIKNFEAGKFNATKIKGDLNYKPRMFSLHEISFNSMSGDVKASGVIIQKFNNDFLVKSQSRLNNININRLFYSFNNFGQDFVTNQNLEGNLTGDVYFTSEWSDKIEINEKSVVSELDVVLNEGELNNFEPMLGLSKYIDVEELKNIKFSSFKSKIAIKNKQIIIPQTDISSSAINITASGEHNFDNTYSYHVKLLLSDLLSKKFRKSKKKNQSFGNIEEDNEGRLILYLLLKGDKDNFNVKYDRKAAKKTRKAELKAERKELKKILNEEFGWFKKDSTINTDTSTKKDKEKFKIEFEEDNKKTKETKDPIQNQKFIIEWEEDSTDNN